MPILIVDHLERRRGLILGERALIGRRPFNTIMVPDPAVSRIHAWVGRRDGRYMLFDSGSRVGTRVNGQPAKTPRELSDGDEIRIGPATITFREGDRLPADIEPLDPSPIPPAADPYDGGIYFDCPCGGPMWVTADLAGAAGRCRYCGQRLIVPHTSGQTARPVTPVGESPAPLPARKPPTPGPAPAPAPAKTPAPPRVPALAAAPAGGREAPPAPPPTIAPEGGMPAAAELETCSICQTPILPSDSKTSCPSCKLTFHAQCWQENYGCSAYGCDQVNVLAPPEAGAGQALAEPLAGPSDYEGYLNAAPAGARTATASFPWESVLLALSFVAMFLSALGFGVPSAVILVASLAFVVAGNPQRKSVVGAAIIVALVGMVAGYGMSMFWWKGVRVWETFFKR